MPRLQAGLTCQATSSRRAHTHGGCKLGRLPPSRHAHARIPRGSSSIRGGPAGVVVDAIVGGIEEPHELWEIDDAVNAEQPWSARVREGESEGGEAGVAAGGGAGVAAGSRHGSRRGAALSRTWR